MDFNANDGGGGNEAAPSVEGVGATGEGDNAFVDHGRDGVGLDTERSGRGRVMDDHHPGLGRVGRG